MSGTVALRIVTFSDWTEPYRAKAAGVSLESRDFSRQLMRILAFRDQ